MDPIIVFVARASGRDAFDQALAHDRLREALNLAFRSYETTFNQTCQTPRFYTSIHDADQPLLSGGSVFQYFAGLLHEGQDTGRDVILVLNGWDALTIDKMTIIRLFGRVWVLDIKINIKVFANQATSTSDSQFFDVNPTKACAILTGDYDPTNDASPDDDTQLFVDTIDKMGTEIQLQNRSYEEVLRMLVDDDARNGYHN
ncbi:hypothetical protein N7457_008989 [Penicillium paradoxum]|uniref:uncharacterized protein n=1 Tax=Penicillium paradoxum TaxID=176176 RepID=UPI002546E6C6|nr:uncharacterized protein N7457_008989 [Penicillium paradoxum]KAJ5774093.1 hypothetical protein N7457_008989 [Penicillium paradoxum]